MAKKPWSKESTRFEHNAYSSFSFGKEIQWGMIGLLATFITDIGIHASTAALILLLPKIWDAINDTLFGIILDRIKLKSGQKYLPWMRVGTAIITICLIFMYSVPMGMSSSGKAAWIVIAYLLFDTGYTMLDIPMFVFPSALTSSITERGEMLGNGRFFAMVGGMVAAITIPVIRPKLGWTACVAMLAILSGCAMTPLLVKSKERVNGEASEVTSDGITFKQMLMCLKTNSQIYALIITTFIVGMTGIDAIISLHVARICWGNEAYAALLMMAAMLPGLIFAKFIPALIRKFDKVYVFSAGCFVSCAAGVFMCLTGTTHLWVYIILSIFKGFGMMIFQIVAYMFSPDTVEFGAYRTGVNASGISLALMSFTNKLRGALVTSFSLALLGLIGFVSGEGAVQPVGLADKLWMLNTLLPALGYLIAGFLMLKVYKLRDKDVQIMSDYNNGRISKEEADRLLEKRYGSAAVHQGR